MNAIRVLRPILAPAVRSELGARFERSDIRAILDDTRARLRTHAPARGGNRAPHPHFGGMTARQWTRFLGIHTHHHIKIIRDIDAKA